jgi:hypothetical protein
MVAFSSNAPQASNLATSNPFGSLISDILTSSCGSSTSESFNSLMFPTKIQAHAKLRRHRALDIYKVTTSF